MLDIFLKMNISIHLYLAAFFQQRQDTEIMYLCVLSATIKKNETSLVASHTSDGDVRWGRIIKILK